jgi:archaea-specific DNA-binding protein
VVYIGDKPVMTYVFEVVGQLNSGAPEVRVKARGKAISRAVDVAEIVRRHKLIEGQVQVQNVKIGTERLTNRDGKDANVSSIEIVLTRSGGPPTVSPVAPGSPPPVPRKEGEAGAPSATLPG